MILMGKQLESASVILIEVANKYKLDIEMTCSLLAELQTNLQINLKSNFHIANEHV